ncbi:cytochrome P450 4d1-like [Zeugodacus cucurbitae]|uniref:cytochrome P450 4d1-like n=1 Tax=Zeugodacus cucurbitae TaxID=28588 RepID=UPI0023D90A6C|nr:cytochrome P450 4d1-like [Zeugodacus cucurbitae]
MFASTVALVFSSLVALLIYCYAKYGRFYALANRFNGPPAWPIIGNALTFVNIGADEFVRRCCEMVEKYGKTCRVWIGPELNIIMHEPHDVEVLLSSNKLAIKSDQYRCMKCWLHDGLLLSHGCKYQQRRKLVSPTFHFRMLEDFLSCFQKHSMVLVQQLGGLCAEGRPFELRHFLGLCMLDTICDTAMGVHIQTQRNADCEYVKALESLMGIIHLRMYDLKYHFDFIFRCTSKAKEAKRALAVINDFAEQVILQRRNELVYAPKAKEQVHEADKQQTAGIKRRKTFLDILLNSTINGQCLSNVDICEEVQTFIFAGHDTLSSALMFFFYCIVTNREWERKCYEEIRSVFGTEVGAISVSREHLNRLHYVDLCIKESLRMYPPVALIGRKALEETKINDHIIPAGTNIGFSPLIFGRLPEVYADPNTFKPERFEEVACENSAKLNPYTFTSFSAGPRSCLGQKYAMLQMKVTVVYILLSFNMEYVGDATQELKLSNELTMRTKDPLMFTVRPRDVKSVN